MTKIVRRGHNNQAGVSIITCTNRPLFFLNLLKNYRNQAIAQKELIIILNKDSMSLQKYRRIAQKFQNVAVYKLPQFYSLGRCLNFGVKKSTYPYIAKFDDDDYYSPFYLRDSLKAFARTKADVVGKRTHFMYFLRKKLLIVRFPFRENKYVRVIAGGTIMAKRRVFERVLFPDRSLGEDVGFLSRCRAKGFRIYSANRFHYVIVRRPNRMSHTWKAKDRQILSNAHRVVGYTQNYKAIARKRGSREKS